MNNRRNFLKLLGLGSMAVPGFAVGKKLLGGTIKESLPNTASDKQLSTADFSINASRTVKGIFVSSNKEIKRHDLMDKQVRITSGDRSVLLQLNSGRLETSKYGDVGRIECRLCCSFGWYSGDDLKAVLKYDGFKLEYMYNCILTTLEDCLWTCLELDGCDNIMFEFIARTCESLIQTTVKETEW